MPESEEEIKKELLRAVSLYNQRPAMPGGYIHSIGGLRQYMTCGNCQIICEGDKKETAKNLKLLHSSGCVFQRPDGALYALPPDEAESVFKGMEQKQKQLYY